MEISLIRRPPSSAEADPRSRFRKEKPPIGGWLPGLQFSAVETSVLNAVVDLLIPAGDGFPAPSQANVLAFFGKYIAPEGQQPKWFPFFGEVEFKQRLNALGFEFVNSSEERQIATLKAIEVSENEFFVRLRDLTYYGYYSRPSVIAAINANLEAGKDLRISPQPYGYSDTMDDWDEDLLTRVEGSYTRTEDVRPVELPECFRSPSAFVSQEQS